MNESKIQLEKKILLKLFIPFLKFSFFFNSIKNYEMPSRIITAPEQFYFSSTTETTIGMG